MPVLNFSCHQLGAGRIAALVHFLHKIPNPLSGITMANQYRVFSLNDDEILHPDGCYHPPAGYDDAILCIEADKISANAIARSGLCQLKGIAIPGADILPGKGRPH